jgi:acetylglutamate kinase
MRVIKVGGRAQEDSALPAAIAAAWLGAPGALCVVHGGGDAVSALQRAMGTEPRFVAGRRVTSASDVELIRMALSGAANKRLVAALMSAGVQAVGISGEDGALITARTSAQGALGRVGAPVGVNVALIVHLLEGGWLPVISPLSRDAEHPAGEPLNVNGDDAAAAIAIALGATELLLVSDVAGVLLDGAPAAELDAVQAQRAVASGAATGGMAAKLEAAVRALDAGVPCVRIGDASVLRSSVAGTSLRAAPVAA